MPTQKTRRNTVYGFPNPLDGIQQEPLIMDRAPTGFDSAELGTIWVDTSANDFRILTQIGANGGNVWTGTTGGSTTLTSLTVDPGDIDVTAGNINVAVGDLTLDAASTTTLGLLNAGDTQLSGTLDVIGNVTLGGDLDVTGNVTITGDFDITDTASISITSTNNAAGAVTIATNGGTSETIVIQSQQGTGAASLNLSSVAGGITLTAGLATADAINFVASAGGIDVDAAGQINIRSTQNAAQAIVIDSTAGGIEIVAAGAPGEDVNISSTAGSLNLSGGEAAANAVLIQAGSAAGGITVNTGTAGLTVTAVNGDIVMNAGLGDILISDDATDAVIEIGTGAAVKDITIGSSDTTSSVVIQSGTNGNTLITTGSTTVDSSGGIEINSSAGSILIGNDAVAQNIGIGTGAAARVITIGNVTGASQVVLNSGTAGVAINTTGAGDVVVTSADTVLIDAAGVLELNSSAGAISIGNDAVAQAINVGTGAAARTLTVGNVTGATTVNLNSGTGGINLSSAGIFTLDAVADSQASPSATSVINANVGAATFTGFTTAAAGTQDFTITNSLVTTSSQILCTVCNEGANDAQMQIRRITRAAGSFVVKVVNAGAAALNGNVTITFIVLN